MKLYRISQNETIGYGVFDSAVVAAPDEDYARNIDPQASWTANQDNLNILMEKDRWEEKYSTWCSKPEFVIVEYLGKATPNIKEPKIILASFNAG